MLRLVWEWSKLSRCLCSVAEAGDPPGPMHVQRREGQRPRCPLWLWATVGAAAFSVCYRTSLVTSPHGGVPSVGITTSPFACLLSSRYAP